MGKIWNLTWYEWLWSALPLLMVYAGGLLGAVCGVVGFALNVRQFRAHPSRVYNFMVTALITIAAITVYFLGGIVIAMLLGSG